MSTNQTPLYACVNNAGAHHGRWCGDVCEAFYLCYSFLQFIELQQPDRRNQTQQIKEHARTEPKHQPEYTQLNWKQSLQVLIFREAFTAQNKPGRCKRRVQAAWGSWKKRRRRLKKVAETGCSNFLINS